MDFANTAESRTNDLLRKNPKLKEQLLERAARGELPELDRFGVKSDEFVASVEGRPMGGATESMGGPSGHAVEAIVRRYGRPVLLVQHGAYVEPDLADLAAELLPNRERIKQAIARVGRVEFVNHAMPWGGTGWVVDERVIVTNRHVAEIVAESDGRGGFRFRMSLGGVPFGANLDFREEYGVAGTETVALKSIRFLAQSNQPDIALLEVESGAVLPTPLDLDEAPLAVDQKVVLIGYPAYDSRNDPADMARYFGDIYDVKRLAPGQIMQPAGAQPFFMHDATTLGGNSGTSVVDPATGKAVGLHYAGTYLQGNYAVSAKHIKAALRGLRVVVSVPERLTAGGAEAAADGTHAAAHFADRRGYAPSFLGGGSRRVPILGLGTWESDAVDATLDGGKTTKAVPYTHFSVVFSESRRVPIFTAVNIDGAKTKRIKRAGDKWYFDLRIPRKLQLTKEDYGHPDIDRGHMVRREDPNWGSPTVAELANDDTFHYTNAAPQHARLNQGRTQWLGLEEYVLSNARTEGFKISVFTGPILRESDRRLDNGVAVPEEFWKVVVAVDAGTQKLRATGYVLSQGKLIEDITEAFAYGEYRGYQVRVSTIEKATGLDFGGLASADPLAASHLETLPGVPPIVPLDRLEDMVL
jgi:endonuclease G